MTVRGPTIGGAVWADAKMSFGSLSGGLVRSTTSRTIHTLWTVTARCEPTEDLMARLERWTPDPRHLRLVASNGKPVER